MRMAPAQMCGNGIRCVAKYVYDYGLTDRTDITVETDSGIKTLHLTVENQKVKLVEVDMGAPILDTGGDSGRRRCHQSCRGWADCESADDGERKGLPCDLRINGQSTLHRAGGGCGRTEDRGDRPVF